VISVATGYNMYVFKKSLYFLQFFHVFARLLKKGSVFIDTGDLSYDWLKYVHL